MARLTCIGKSDVGLKRSNNEDTFLVDPDLNFCLVADGIGGAAAGEFASRIFAETAAEVLAAARPSSETSTLAAVQTAFSTANDRLRLHIQQNPSHQGMGCTAELLACHPEGFVLGHLGDSRTYRLRNHQLKQLTEDHTLVQAQVTQGLLSPQEAMTHPMRNVILRAVDGQSELELDLLRGKLQAGDLFLLCSDGLTDMVDDGLILELAGGADPLARKVDRLIAAALAAGGKDNITVVLCEY